jgi:hypothetical protein
MKTDDKGFCVAGPRQSRVFVAFGADELEALRRFPDHIGGLDEAPDVTKAGIIDAFLDIWAELHGISDARKLTQDEQRLACVSMSNRAKRWEDTRSGTALNPRGHR